MNNIKCKLFACIFFWSVLLHAVDSLNELSPILGHLYRWVSREVNNEVMRGIEQGSAVKHCVL